MPEPNKTASTIATGSLFRDRYLKPGETITRTLVFHVPTQEYDLVDVTAMMPSLGKEKRLGLDWKLNAESSILEPIMYWVSGTPNIELENKTITSRKRLQVQGRDQKNQISLQNPFSLVAEQ